MVGGSCWFGRGWFVRRAGAAARGRQIIARIAVVVKFEFSVGRFAFALEVTHGHFTTVAALRPFAVVVLLVVIRPGPREFRVLCNLGLKSLGNLLQVPPDLSSRHSPPVGKTTL
jgi:hypothetical protein